MAITLLLDCELFSSSVKVFILFSRQTQAYPECLWRLLI